MKKMILLAFCLLSVIACQKEQVTKEKPIAASKNSGNCTDFNEAHFLENPNDEDDENVNYAMYYMAMALREVLAQYPELLADIKTKAGQDVGYEVNLNTFASDHPTIIPILNAQIALLSNNKPSGFNYATYIGGLMQHSGVNYVPVVYIPNYPTADFSQVPYMGIGAQIDENVYPEKENHIPVWYDNNGVCNFLTMGETEAIAATNPVLIVVNGVIHTGAEASFSNLKIDKGRDNSIQASIGQAKSNLPTFLQETVRVFHTYESSGNSEYNVYSYHAMPTHPLYTFGEAEREFSLSRAAILAASPFQLWHRVFYAQQSSAQNIPWIDPSNLGFCQSFMATYERDWNQGRKLLGTYCDWQNNNAITQKKARMKYSHEWYHFDPAANNGFCHVPCYPSNYHIIVYSSPKGQLKMWRVDQ